MKRFPANTVLKHIGLGFVLVSVVVFLTLMFSLLGAISCAVVSGMILGAARLGKLRSILVSLVFPGVTLILAHVSHALQERENIQFSSVCFGSFWIAYFVTYGLVLLERKAPQPAVQGAAGGPAAPREHDAGLPFRTDAASDSASQASGEPRLEELRGRWSCQTSAQDGQSHTKLLEIDGDRFALSTADPSGRTLSVARGGVRFEKLGPFNTLKILNCDGAFPPDKRAVSPPTWVYRIEAQALTLVLNLESPPGELRPTIETYIKLPDEPRQQGVSEL